MYGSEGSHSGTLMYCSEVSHSGTLMYGSEGSQLAAMRRSDYNGSVMLAPIIVGGQDFCFTFGVIPTGGVNLLL